MDAASEIAAVFVLNACWQVPVVFGAAWIAARALGRARAAHRHAVWVAACVLAAALPAASLFDAAPAPARPSVEAGAAAAGGYDGSWLWAGGLRPPRAPAPGVDPLVARFVGAAYAAWTLSRLVALARATAATRALGRAAWYVHEPAVVEAAADCAAALGVRRVELLASRRVGVPSAIGALRPAVVVPERMTRAGESSACGRELRAALAHELAHVRRRDYAVNFACELLLLPVSFHPLVRPLRRRLAATREVACDELVTERLIGRADYARALVAIARAAAATPGAGHSLGAAGAGDLEERVMNLLEPEPRIGRARLAAALAASVLLLAVTTATAAVNGFRAGDVPAAARWIEGTWSVHASDAADKYAEGGGEKKAGEVMHPVLKLRYAGDVLEGTVTFPEVKQGPDGPEVVARPEVVVTDPRFDGTTFTFRVFNGEEYLEGVLTRSGESLTGTWTASKSGRNGTVSMHRME